MIRPASGVRREGWLGRTHTASPHASRLTSHGRKEAGYTLVALVIGMAVLTILIAAVGPSIGTIMKREREEELLFRGKQYARAIALFQRRYGRYPNELKELYENRPRTIRKLWKDPTCDCDGWHLLIQGRPDAVAGDIGVPSAGGAPRPPGAPGPPGHPGGASPGSTPGPFGTGSGSQNVGPIVGVRSNLHKEALAEWRGRKFYDEWRFIAGDADRENAPFDPNTLRLPNRPTPR